MQMIKYSTIENMVSTYNSAVEAIYLFENIHTKQHEQLEQAFDRYVGFQIFDEYYNPKQKIEKLKASCWYKILNKTNILQAITEKQKDEIIRQIEKGQTPEITVDNVNQMLQNLLSSLPDMLKDLCKSVFETLTPARYGSKYKTNKIEIKDKVILTHAVSFGYSFCISSYSESRVEDIDKVFHLLDSKGLPKRGNSLKDIIEMNYRDKKETTGETPYFRYKIYKNGNLHLEFRRPDLVKELNRLGGNGTLKNKKL